MLWACGGTVLLASPHLREPFTATCGALGVLLVVPVVLLDAGWIVTLCVLAGIVVLLVGVTRGRTVPGFLLAGLAWPLASLRGLPWFGRTLRTLGVRGNTTAMARTAAWSVLGVVVFGLLFISADALVASWAGAILPDWEIDAFVTRGFIAGFVFAVVLAAAYLSLNPPRTEPFADRETAPVRHRYEWLVPVLLVDAVFLVFLVAQATVVFGGHDYLESTTGLTYADYVHQGFGQLTVATALTLLVVWAAARKAPRETPADRAWLRGALGLLCVLTLVVVASALYRMHVYQEAYGFTRLRLLVDVFEGWLGLLVLGVMAAGVGLRGWWLPAGRGPHRCGGAAGAGGHQPRCLDRAQQPRARGRRRRRRWTSTTCSTRCPPMPSPSWSTGCPTACPAPPRRQPTTTGWSGTSGARGRPPRSRTPAWSPAPPSQSRNRFVPGAVALPRLRACPDPTPTTTPSR